MHNLSHFIYCQKYDYKDKYKGMDIFIRSNYLTRYYRLVTVILVTR